MLENSPETLQLLEAARQGDAWAVEQLLGRHRERLRRRISLRLDPALGTRLDASDVIQDVLIEASRRLGDYLTAPTMPFHLWLRHIADDHVIDAWRRHRQAQRRSLDREQRLDHGAKSDRSSLDWAAGLAGRDLTPASAAMRHEMENQIRAAIGRLSAEDQEILSLKHEQQIPNQDVARRLGLSEAAASMRYLRAVRRLRASLTPAISQGDG